MLPELGLPYMWSCIGNLLVVVLLQYVAQVPRPIDLEPSWAMPSNTDPDTFGFPCVDSHLSIVVLLPVIENSSSVAIQAILSGLIVVLAITKLCTASRFLSQIIGSWLTGLTGVLLGNHGHFLVQAYHLPRGYK